eukprot:CCRYP_008087-RA/>CCRYP_008087-RA protein AED:0.00 eAED:0.00 QI:350/-1/1/1/-1/1/1/343/471
MDKKKMLSWLYFLWISAAAKAAGMSKMPTQSAMHASMPVATRPSDDVSSASSAITATTRSTPVEQLEDDDEDTASSFEEQMNQNPYVKASPLSVAAVCSDGVALISLHYGVDDDFYADNDEVEQITNASDKVPSRIVNVTEEDEIIDIREDSDGRKNQHSWSHPFRDLPISTRGPLRIEPVYSHQDHGMPTSASRPFKRATQRLPPPMAILTAGWRTDGMTLANAARELIVEERMLYCLPYLVLSSDGVSSDSVSITHDSAVGNSVTGGAQEVNEGVAPRPMPTYYGRRIADGLSYYLAKCEFSESVRSLSTVGLLACGSNNNNYEEGSIFLIDATGAYRVRAHAIGAGASQLNRRMGYVDFRKMSCREGLRVLLKLTAEESGLTDIKPSMVEIETAANAEDKAVAPFENVPVVTERLPKPAFVVKRDTLPGRTHPRPRLWNLPKNIAVELAIIENGEGRMKRIRLAALDN